MELAPADVQLTFEVTFQNPGLPVAMSVYATTGGSPVLVSGPTAMENIAGTNTYIGFFTPAENSDYLILKAVYTDESFTTIDTDYGQGSESITTQPQSGGAGGGSGCEIIGLIQTVNNVVGFIQTGNTLVGLLEC